MPPEPKYGTRLHDHALRLHTLDFHDHHHVVLGCGDADSRAGSCVWVVNVAYNDGEQVIYNGHLWTANW